MRSERKHITAVLEDDTEAKEFIYGGKKLNIQPPSHPATQESSPLDSQPSIKRRKISIRLPQDLDEMLSKVWHERGLAHSQGKLPAGQVREKQDIIAEALREWFQKRNYLNESSS